MDLSIKVGSALVLLGILFITAGSVAFSYYDTLLPIVTGEFGVALLGSAVTILFVDQIYKRQQTERDKRIWIAQLSSADIGLVENAVRQLHDLKCLQDGSLDGHSFRRAAWAGFDGKKLIARKADLREVNAEGANFESASFRGCTFSHGTFANANFESADLQGVWADHANFDGADFDGANLSRGVFSQASFAGARLTRCSLHGSYLEGARLADALIDQVDVSGAVFDSATTWPGDPPPHQDAPDSVFRCLEGTVLTAQ